MSRRCAFCPETAKLSGEHIWSDWMDALYPGGKTFRGFGQLKASWKASELNLKARVVCEPCNNGWMSDIENKHAKPAMKDLILGKLDVPVSQSHAGSIALFAFKTAVILDHMNSTRATHFFSRRARDRFRETLEIPNNVSMWMAGCYEGKGGGCLAFYNHTRFQHFNTFEFYVCNYFIGHFAFQVVSESKPTGLNFTPSLGFEHLAVPFWPRIPEGFVWPPKAALKSRAEFKEFSARWHTVGVSNLTRSR